MLSNCSEEETSGCEYAIGPQELFGSGGEEEEKGCQRWVGVREKGACTYGYIEVKIISGYVCT